MGAFRPCCNKCGNKGWAAINPDGTVAASCGSGITSEAIEVGRYQLTPPAGATIAHVSVVEAWGTRDSITARLEDFAGNRVHVTEGDNGTAPNPGRWRGFTITWN